MTVGLRYDQEREDQKGLNIVGRMLTLVILALKQLPSNVRVNSCVAVTPQGARLQLHRAKYKIITL